MTEHTRSTISPVKTLLTHLLIWLPTVFGGLFYAVVKFDHSLYQAGRIGVRGAIGIEFVYLLICCVVFLVSLGVGVQLLRQGKWWGIACVGISFVLGLYLLAGGFNSGAAILYAT